jgi:hypothetical protein
MSKINCQFKLKDLYAIKHALEFVIAVKGERLILSKEDKEHDKKIVDYVVEVISRFKTTQEHYSEIKQ